MILLRIKTVRLLYGASDALFKLGSAMHDRVKQDMAAAGVSARGSELRVDTPVNVDREPGIAGRVLLASLVGMSIALTYLWLVVRAS